MAISNTTLGIEADILGELARFRVDPSVYTETAIFKASYWFTNEFFIFVDRTGDGHFLIEMRAKADADIAGATGEFCNALIDARVRQIVLLETGAARDELLQKAFQEGMPLPGFSNIRSNEDALSGGR